MNNLCEQPELAEHCAEILKALAHPLRLRIVAILCQGEESVGRLAERLGANQATVSQHLRILRMRDLVGFTRKEGFAMYWLAEKRLTEIVRCVEQCGAK
jgi:ArsR family transcriptional regulator